MEPDRVIVARLAIEAAVDRRRIRRAISMALPPAADLPLAPTPDIAVRRPGAIDE